MGFIGGLAAGKDDNYKVQRDRARRILKKTQLPAIDQFFSQARGNILDAQRAEVGGYTDALKDAERIGLGSKRTALRLGEQAQGANAQTATDAGLGVSSLVGSNSQGIAGQTAEALAAIDESLAGVYANLRIGRGSASARGSAALAGVDQAQYQALTQDYIDPLFNATVGLVGPKNSQFLSSLAGGEQTAEQLFAYFAGGGGFGG